MPQNRRSYLKKVSSGITLAGLGISGTAQSLQNNLENINGNNDSDIWVDALLKIINPVVENMANRSLNANMPFYLGPNYYLKVKQFTFLEAVSRNLAGIAPWLATCPILLDISLTTIKFSKSFEWSNYQKRLQT
jgi:hypothetical protein